MTLVVNRHCQRSALGPASGIVIRFGLAGRACLSESERCYEGDFNIDTGKSSRLVRNNMVCDKECRRTGCLSCGGGANYLGSTTVVIRDRQYMEVVQ